MSELSNGREPRNSTRRCGMYLKRAFLCFLTWWLILIVNLQDLESPLRDISGNTCERFSRLGYPLVWMWVVPFRGGPDKEVFVFRLFVFESCSWVHLPHYSHHHCCCHQSPLKIESHFFGLQTCTKYEWLARNPPGLQHQSGATGAAASWIALPAPQPL